MNYSANKWQHGRKNGPQALAQHMDSDTDSKVIWPSLSVARTRDEEEEGHLVADWGGGSGPARSGKSREHWLLRYQVPRYILWYNILH